MTSGEHDRLPVLATTFHLSSAGTLNLRIAVAGVAIVTVNGGAVTDYVLEPGYSDFEKEIEVTDYDISALVRRGTNTIEVAIGPGMYRSRSDDGRWAKLHTDFGDPCVRLAVLRPGDPVPICVSGTHWKSIQGGTTRSNWTGGEDYDGRMTLPTGARSTDEWPNAIRPPRPPSGFLVPRSSVGLKIVSTLSAMKVERTPTGTWAVDFGRNISGWPVVAVPANSRVSLKPAELRHPDGVIDSRTQGWGPVFHTVQTGDDAVEWHPRFMYNGFRFIEVDGLDVATLDMFKANVIAADVPASGDFTCSDPMLVRIHELIRGAVWSNAFSVFTDCPQREKLGYLEQLHLAFDCIVRNVAAEPILRRTVQLMIQAQRRDGSIGLYVPEWEGFPSPWRDDINFGGAIGFLPWRLFREFGDRSVLSNAYPALKRYLAFVRSGLVGGIVEQGLGDWNGHDFRYVSVVASLTLHKLLRVAASIAVVLGHSADAAELTSEANALLSVMRERFVNDDGVVGEGSLAELAVSIDAKLFSAQEERDRVDQLDEGVQAAGYGVDVGEVAMSALVAVLTRYSRSKTLSRLCSVTDRPGYGYMVRHGATTLTETWDGPTFGYSQNHFMNGSISTWFFDGILGITQTDDSIGYRKITIAPQTTPVDAASGWIDTPAGRVEVSWSKQDAVFVIEGCVPAASSCVVQLPSGKRQNVSSEFRISEPISES